MADSNSIAPIDPGPMIAAMNQATEASLAVNTASAVDQAKEGMYSAVSQTGSKVYQG
jgi:hypothetical protein